MKKNFTFIIFAMLLLLLIGCSTIPTSSKSTPNAPLLPAIKPFINSIALPIKKPLYDFNQPPAQTDPLFPEISLQSSYDLLNGFGDFTHQENGLASGLVLYDGINPSCTDGVQTYTADARYGNLYFEIEAEQTHIYYLCAIVRSASDLVGVEFMDDPLFPIFLHSGSGDWEFLSVVYEKSIPDEDLLIAVCDTADADWTPVSVKTMRCYDLTEIYGAGQEPSKDMLDTQLAFLIN